jgi:hypothetical protein
MSGEGIDSIEAGSGKNYLQTPVAQVKPDDLIGVLGLSNECVDILQQLGVNTCQEFADFQWRQGTTISGATPGMIYTFLKFRDRLKSLLPFVGQREAKQEAKPLQPAPASGPNPMLPRQQELDLLPPEISLTAELPADFFSVLGLSVRALNVLHSLELRSLSSFLALEKAALKSRRNCGKKTAAEIMSAVQTHRLQMAKPSVQPGSVCDLDFLELTPLATIALNRLGISTTDQLERVSAQSFLKLGKLGQQCIYELRLKLYQWLGSHQDCQDCVGNDTPISYLRLSARVQHCIEALGITTVGDLARIPSGKLLRGRNFGKKSFLEVQMKLLDFMLGKLTPRRGATLPNSPKVFLDELIAKLPQRDREILVSRFGLWDGTRTTLGDLGDVYGCSRERIRQIESKAIEALRWPGNLDLIHSYLARIERKLFRPIYGSGHGIASEEELRAAFLTLFASPTEGMIAERLLTDVFLGGQSIYDQCGLKVQDGLFALDESTHKMCLSVMDIVRNRLVNSQTSLPIEKLASAVRRQMPTSRRRSNRRFILRCLDVSPDVSRDRDGLCGLASRIYMGPGTMRDLIVCALTDIGKPAHFTQIAMRLEEKYPDKAPFNTRYLHARLGYDQEIFVWQAPGVYGLGAWGLKKAPYVKDRLISILESAGSPMSLDQIVPRVLETCRCKDRTVGAILEAHPEIFLRFDTGVYGLRK